LETEVNPRNQHLRREIFSEAQFGEWSAKFSRNFKEKFCQPDREFESSPVRHKVAVLANECRLCEARSIFSRHSAELTPEPA
jgi:hypothetical protein